MDIIQETFEKANCLLDAADWKLTDSDINKTLRIVNGNNTDGSTLIINGESAEFNHEYSFPKDSIILINCKNTNCISYVNKVQLSEDQSITIDLELSDIVIDISCNVDDAKIQYTTGSDYQTVENNRIIIKKGSELKLIATKEGYQREFLEYKNIIENKQIQIFMTKEKFLLKVLVTNLEDAIVSINGTDTNEMELEEGKTATVKVTREGYKTITEDVTITEDITKEYEMEIEQFTIKIGTKPSKAKVTIDGEEIRQKTVDYGTEVEYEVSMEHYQTVTNKIVVNKNIHETVELQLEKYSVVVKGVSKEADIFIDGQKTKVDVPVEVEYGKDIEVKVTQIGYRPYTENYRIVEDTEITVEEWRKPTVEVQVKDENGDLPTGTIIKVNGIVTPNGVKKEVNYGTKVGVIVTSPGFKSFTVSEEVFEDKIFSIILEKEAVATRTITVNIPDEYKVWGEPVSTINGNEALELIVPVSEKAQVIVDAPGFKQFTYTVPANCGDQTVDVKMEKYVFDRFIIHTIPVDAAVFIRYEKSSSFVETKQLNDIVYGTKIFYKAEKYGYVSKEGEFLVTERQMEIALKEEEVKEEDRPDFDVLAKVRQILIEKQYYKYLAIGAFVVDYFQTNNMSSLEKFYNSFKTYVVDKQDMLLLKLLGKLFDAPVVIPPVEPSKETEVKP